MEPYTNEQQAIIEKAILRFLEKNKELILRRLLAPEGIDIAAATDKDINLRTLGTGKAYYNDVEIGSGGGGDYVVKTEGAGDQSVYNEIQMRKGTEIKFFVTTGPTEAGSIGSFVGITIADLLILAQTGYLYLQAAQGIKIESPLATSLGMGGYGITSLGAPTAETDGARYKDAIIVCTSTTRPSSPTEGMHIYETDTDKTLKWDGAAWIELGAGGGGVSGSGSTGFIPKWATSTSLNDSILKQLSVQEIGIMSSGNALLSFWYGAAEKGRITSDINGLLIESPNNYLALAAANTIQLGILGIQKIGVGSDVTISTTLSMEGYKITRLGAPSAQDDGARYKDAIIVCTSGTRPTSPTEGMHIYETDTDKTLKWDGTSWVEMGGYLNKIVGSGCTGSVVQPTVECSPSGYPCEIHATVGLGGKWIFRRST